MTLHKHFYPQMEENAAMRKVTLPLFTIHILILPLKSLP